MLKKMILKLAKDTHLKIAIKLRKMKQLQFKTDMKFSLTLMKAMQTDVILVMRKYLIMSQQAYPHGK